MPSAPSTVADFESASSASTEVTGRPPTHRRYNKACDACHSSKVKCVPEPLSATSSCKRCARSNVPCVYTPIGPRRRPTRTKNQRIAELERRVQDMQLLLKRGKSAGGGSAGADHGTPGTASAETASLVDSPRTSSEAGARGAAFAAHPGPAGTPDTHFSTPAATDAPSPSSSVYTQASSNAAAQPIPPAPPSAGAGDVVHRGVLSPARAAGLVHAFRTEIDGLMLGTVLPRHMPDAELRYRRPVLWLSVLCAASTGSETDAELAPLLHQEMDRVLEERLGEDDPPPSIELAQSLHNWMSYHFDPSFPKQQLFLRYSRACVKMVVSLAQSCKHISQPGPGPVPPEVLEDEETLEICREILVWYWGSFIMTMKVRQPLLLRFNDLVKQSLKILENSQLHTDRVMVEWIRLVRIAQQTVSTLVRGYISPQGLDAATRDVVIQRFEANMRLWMQSCELHSMTGLLLVEYDTFIIMIGEVYFPEGRYDISAFERRNQGLPSLTEPCNPPMSQHLLAPWKIVYTRKCISSAHTILDLFTSVEPRRFRRMVNIAFGRVFYSLRFLLLLAHSIWVEDAAHLIDPESLRLDRYIYSMEESLDRASDGKFRVAAIWLYALRSRLKPWFRAFCKLRDSGVRPQRGTSQHLPLAAAPSQADAVSGGERPGMGAELPPPAPEGPTRFAPYRPRVSIPAAPLPPQLGQPTSLDLAQEAPLDIFDASEFMPGNLGEITAESAEHPHPDLDSPIFSRMDVDMFTIGFNDVYNVLSPTVAYEWHQQWPGGQD